MQTTETVGLYGLAMKSLDQKLFILGMSFCVRFKVRTFGNKHPDGLNVRTFFYQIMLSHVCTSSVPLTEHL